MKKNLYCLFCIVLFIGCNFQSRAQIISTYAGTGYTGNTRGSVPATLDSFNVPTSVSVNSRGELFINDQGNSCVRMVRNTAGKITTTVAGADTAGYNGDNKPATMAWLFDSWAIAVDNAGNLYIADQDNYCVRKVDTFGIITTIAGIPQTGGSGGDGGPATLATFVRPFGIAVDQNNNIYVCDQDEHTVRKINNSGVISTIAGKAGVSGSSGDGGPATAGTIGLCWGIGVDTSGNVYICDGGNNNVRKVTASGIISTIAGTGVAGYNGDGIAARSAQLNYPTGVYLDHSGNIYIADCFNDRIREINPSGIITTIAGNGTAGFSGDGYLATAAQLDHPTYVAMDDSENIYINDLANVRIRKIRKIKLFTRGHFQYINVCENSVADPIDSVLMIRDYYTGLTDSWRILSNPQHGSVFVTYSTTSTGDTIMPAGLYYTPTGGYIGADSFGVVVSDGIIADTTTIYVNVKPAIPADGIITGQTAVCPGSGITLSDTLTGGTWSSTNSNAMVTPHGSNCTVTGVYAGVDTIEYAIYNNCGTGIAMAAITVNPLPDTGTVAGPANMCAGDTILLTDTVAGGYWTSSDTNAVVIPVGNGIKITSVITGDDIVKYTVSDSFCTAAATKIVTINPLPFVGAITGPSVVCIGSAIMLADSVVGGTWGSGEGYATATDGTTAATGAVTGVAAGMDTILYTVNFYCGTATATKTIIVEPLPAAPSIIQSGYFLSVPAGYAFYQWELNGTAIPGAVLDTFIETVAGLYSVVVGNADSCFVSSPAINCPDCNASELRIYPNPGKDIVNIEWCKQVTVKIMCMDGKIFEIREATNEVNISALPDGVYLLVLFDGQGNRLKTQRVTKLSQK